MFTNKILIKISKRPTNKFSAIFSCNKKELKRIAISGMRNVKEPTLLASPEFTSVKNASHPNAITKKEMKSKFIINGISHWIFDQLSTLVPTINKKRPPIISCNVTIQMESTRSLVFLIKTVPSPQDNAEPKARIIIKKHILV
ncbi:hypothetical protein BS1321_03315 [Peribacillus simplex NBRC 15720 = DSM 1321]|uniref:Uncharacterized protein n=1 Tax=Peribacillus simplex NBRC 15720 = DSM 1321 TaxID=1349754 RepID=A0A223EDA9_9BACI|nr:hypothetical protein BS1321_03315 [Peribacillus simplex NBRC 15720 = DSM 1321]